ncbi:MAG: hypothetical protein BV456_04615 [Thermoplasmata archaeon M8B2D]|nr:MAG: hypothetical protein BV456_04615 [Thermoplasmata archaeon M8B2D]
MDETILYLLYLVSSYNLKNSDKLFKLYCQDEANKIFKSLKPKDLDIYLHSYKFISPLYFSSDFEESARLILGDL